MTPITIADWQAGKLRGWNFFDASQPSIYGPADFTALAATGANHARVWLQARWIGAGYLIDDDQLARMDACLDALAAVGVHAVIVLSIDQAQQPWGSAQRGQALAVLWGSLAARWGDDRAVVAGFDLLNEPTPGQPVDGAYTPEQFAQVAAEWPGIATLCARYIRIHAPGRVIVYEVGMGADPSQFVGDPLPLDGIVYSTHIYRPHGVTHQGTSEWNAGSRAFPIPRSVDAQCMAELQTACVQVLAGFKGLPVYVGEFGCANWVPGHWRYLQAVSTWCNANGFNWAAHAYRQWPGWDYEAVPDGRTVDANLRPVLTSATTSAMRALRAAFVGIEATGLPVSDPPAPTPEPAPMQPIPDPLPATPAPPVTTPAPAPDPGLAAYVATMRDWLVQWRAESAATQVRFDAMLARAQAADNARNAVLRGTDADVAATFHAALLQRGTTMGPETLASTVAEHVRAHRAKWPQG